MWYGGVVVASGVVGLCVSVMLQSQEIMLLDPTGRGVPVMLHDKMTGDENIQAGLSERGARVQW